MQRCVNQGSLIKPIRWAETCCIAAVFNSPYWLLYLWVMLCDMPVVLLPPHTYTHTPTSHYHESSGGWQTFSRLSAKSLAFVCDLMPVTGCVSSGSWRWHQFCQVLLNPSPLSSCLLSHTLKGLLESLFVCLCVVWLKGNETKAKLEGVRAHWGPCCTLNLSPVTST